MLSINFHGHSYHPISRRGTFKKRIAKYVNLLVSRGLVRFFLLILASISMSLAAPAFGSTEPNDIFGVWLMEGGSAKLEIFPCGEKACAKVIWLKRPNYVDNINGTLGKDRVDQKNSDPALRNRPIVGLQVMDGMSLDGDWWRNGSCYDPQSGQTYQCKMRLESPSEIRVRGYIGMSLIGRTCTLKRDLPSQVKAVHNP